MSGFGGLVFRVIGGLGLGYLGVLLGDLGFRVLEVRVWEFGSLGVEELRVSGVLEKSTTLKTSPHVPLEYPPSFTRAPKPKPQTLNPKR